MVPKYRSARDSGLASATGKSDLQMLHDLRFDYPKNLLCGNLNIISLTNKIHDLRLILHDVPLDYLVIRETKLGNSIKDYFHNMTDNNIVTNKMFCNFIRSFLTNKHWHQRNSTSSK